MTDEPLQVLVDADNVGGARLRMVLASLAAVPPEGRQVLVVGSRQSLAGADWPADAEVLEASGWQRADVALADRYRPGPGPLLLVSGDGDFALLALRHRGPVLVVSGRPSNRLRDNVTVVDPVHDGPTVVGEWLHAVGAAPPPGRPARADAGRDVDAGPTAMTEDR